MEEERRTSRSLPDRLNSPDQGPFPSPTHSSGQQAAPPHSYIPPRDQRNQWREPHPRPHSAYAREPPSFHQASLSPYPHPNVPFPPSSPARPPSSSSDSGSASGAGSRFRAPKNERSSGPHLAPPPLAAYVTPDRRYFAPPPAQEQWLGPDGRRISSQDRDRPAFPPVQRPPPDHVLAAASAAARHHPPPPLSMSFRPGPSSEGSSQSSSPTRKIYPTPGGAGGSGMLLQGQGQTPTTMQFSRLTTVDSRSPLTPPLPKREELPGPTGRYGYPGELDRPPPGVRQQPLPPQGWYPPVPAVLPHASSPTAFPAGPSTSHTIHPRPTRPRAFSSSSHHSAHSHHSHPSHHSAQSAHSRQSRSEQMHRGHSVGSTSSRASSRMEGSVSSSTGTAHESGALGGDGGLGLQSMGRLPGGEKKKRTRALMTHTQQSGLTRLWKKTKFPTSNDREKLGLEIGLTPRQVQVWFQNQRQKSRKALQVNGGVPEGEDPADYEDLQKSPRSRRLSMEQEDRVSAWAGSSSSSSSTGWHLGEFAAYEYGRERVGGHHAHGAGIGGPAGQPLGPGGMPPSGALPVGMGKGMGYSPSPEYERWEYSMEYAGYQGHPSHHGPTHSLSMPQPHQQQPHQQRFPQRSPRRPHTYPHPHAHPPALPPISTAWDREREREYFPSVLQPPRSAGAISQGSVRSVPYSSPPANMSLPPLEASVPPPNWGPPGSSSYRYGPAPPERPRPASSSGARRRSRSTEHMSHPPVHPPSIPSAPLVSSETSQRRPRSPSKASIQSTRSMLSKSSSPPTTAESMSKSARTTHLPPNLARIAIRGPVSGGQGEDLPGIDAGDADEKSWAGAGKGLGSPRKRLGEWEGHERRVRGRGEGRGSLSEEEGEGRKSVRAAGAQA